MDQEESHDTRVAEQYHDYAGNVLVEIVPQNTRRVALRIISSLGTTRFSTQPGVVGYLTGNQLPGMTDVDVNRTLHGALAQSQWWGYGQSPDTFTIIEVLRD